MNIVENKKLVKCWCSRGGLRINLLRSFVQSFVMIRYMFIGVWDEDSQLRCTGGGQCVGMKEHDWRETFRDAYESAWAVNAWPVALYAIIPENTARCTHILMFACVGIHSGAYRSFQEEEEWVSGAFARRTDDRAVDPIATVIGTFLDHLLPFTFRLVMIFQHPKIAKIEFHFYYLTELLKIWISEVIVKVKCKIWSKIR